jgi:hypothetical protein
VEEVVVRLLKHSRPDTTYRASIVFDDGTHVVVRAPWGGPGTRDMGFVRFEDGDLFTEHFWRDRWYSIKEVHASDGGLKGWYCDIARPAVVAEGEIVVEDLYLDLWVGADGSIIRLDEDEFAAAGLDPVTAERAMRALDELEAHCRTRVIGYGLWDEL